MLILYAILYYARVAMGITSQWMNYEPNSYLVAFDQKEKVVLLVVVGAIRTKNRYLINPHLLHYKMAKCKQWSDVSMTAAVNCVQKEGKGLKKSNRLHCRPGPPTMLTEED